MATLRPAMAAKTDIDAVRTEVKALKEVTNERFVSLISPARLKKDD
jgi:hypothetical protein